jgi:hypothetical protein
MDAGEHYRHLAALGEEAFLAAAAPGALVRFRAETTSAGTGGSTLTLDEDEDDSTIEETVPIDRLGPEGGRELELFPIAKKPGASFPDRITIGRTSNNDIVIPEHSVSRLHAYIRPQGDGFVFADAGSKNGSWLQGEKLAARKEKPLVARAIVRVGEVDLTFYRARELFAMLGGSRA